jgi:hypothetical protein
MVSLFMPVKAQSCPGFQISRILPPSKIPGPGDERQPPMLISRSYHEVSPAPAQSPANGHDSPPPAPSPVRILAATIAPTDENLIQTARSGTLRARCR